MNPLEPGLYIVATPIGNLADLSPRAAEILSRADVVAVEDSRVTAGLLRHIGVKRPMLPYHDHNAEGVRPGLIARMGSEAVALVSDAGTPLISDPGYKLVREACAAGHVVDALPGPSAVLTALSVAALPTDRFFFEGFLPSREGARRARIQELARLDATLVLLESGNRVAESLSDLAELLGSRDAALCRELTKLHEDVRRGPLATLAAQAATGETRGEFVLVIGPPAAVVAMGQDDLDALLRDRLKHDSVKDAVAHAVEASGRPRREVYARALELAKDGRDDD